MRRELFCKFGTVSIVSKNAISNQYLGMKFGDERNGSELVRII